MSKGIIAIIDNNQAYSHSLCDYLDIHFTNEYTTACFSSIEDFELFPYKNDICFLLISEEYIPTLEYLWQSINAKDISKPTIHTTCILTDSKYKEDVNIESYPDVRFKNIYRYQSADNICKLIYETASTVTSRFNDCSAPSPTNVYGVYSPIKRCGRTSFSLSLAMILSLKSPTLFISLDENANYYLASHSTNKSVSDVLINFIEHPEGIYSYIHSCLVTINGLDILMPPQYSQDIRGLSTDTINSFIRSLNNCGYKNIIIDFSDTTKDIVSHLIQCTKVYMPVLEEDISQSKIRSFLETSKQVNKSFENVDITDVYVPTFDYRNNDSEYINQLMLSPITQYINGLISNKIAFTQKYDR